MAQALYRKWRPRQWDEVVGQEHIVQTLKNAVAGGRVGHAYLFAGPRGTGKTTTARLLAKAVNCLAPDPADRPCNQCENCQALNEGRFLDLIEIDAASNTSVDDVRDLRDKINFSPSKGAFKVYIIDEVHMLSTAAFNALLKTLEEPPDHAIFILATTEVHKIPATVLSRCQRHEFRRIPVQEIVVRLKAMAGQEGLQVEPEALTLIARQATGSLRDAISLLDQLASVDKSITLAIAQTVLGTAASQAVIDLTRDLLERDPAAGMDLIHRALDGGTDPRQFARQIVDYLRGLLLIRMGNSEAVDVTREQLAQMALQAQAFDVPRLLEVVRIFNAAATDLRSGWQPSLPLELAFAEAIQEKAPGAAREEPSGAKPTSRPEPAPSTGNTPAPAAGQSPAPAAGQTPAPGPTPARSAAAPESSPPTPPPAASAPSPATPGGGSLNFQAVVQSWPKVRALVKKHRSQTDGLLNSCRLLGIKEGVLVLGFDTEIVKSKMEKGDHTLLTQQALRQVLGADLPVRCVVANKKSGELPEDLAIEDDGMVAAALRDMGGKVVDIQ